MPLTWLTIAAVQAQALSNPGLDGPVPSDVPNQLEATSWTFLGADLAQSGVPIDCAGDVLVASSDGGTFAHAVAYYDNVNAENVRQALRTEVSELDPGIAYKVVFEAAVVRHWGQSDGRWLVSFGGEVRMGPVLEVPAANPGQSAWERIEVFPFTAPAETATLAFATSSAQNGTTDSPDLPGGGCDYDSDQNAVGLLLDGVEIYGDPDQDLLFDDDEIEIGTSPDDPDTDGDGLLDGVEVYRHRSNPRLADSDDDGLSDGDEVEAGTDLRERDTDQDGLTDGEEVHEHGTDPVLSDTDEDGLEDGSEVVAGTSPLDACSPVPADGVNPATGEDCPEWEPRTDRSPGKTPSGCDCDAVPGWPGGGGVLVGGLLLALRRRRRER